MLCNSQTRLGGGQTAEVGHSGSARLSYGGGRGNGLGRGSGGGTGDGFGDWGEEDTK